MKRLDETYNFPNIMHFEMCKIKLLEVKNYFQAPQTVSAHAIVATAKFCPGKAPPAAPEGYIKPRLASLGVYSVLKAGRSPAHFVREFWSFFVNYEARNY